MKPTIDPMLFRSPQFTLLLIAGSRLVRADFAASGSRMLGLWQRARPEGLDLPSLVELALHQQKKSPGRVAVLATEVWTQSLRMPPDALLGLSPLEQSRVLAFEAEAISGIPAIDSLVGFRPLAADLHEFEIVQLPSWQRDRIDEIVGHAGGSLLGIAHPGSLAAPFEAESARAWQRVEIWPGTIIARRESLSGASSLIINADPRQRSWHANVTTWLAGQESAPPATWLLAEEPVSLPDSPGVSHHTERLFDEAVLGHWLAVWARQISVHEAAVPWVRPELKPMSAQRRTLLGAGLAAAVGLACFVHYRTNEAAIKAYTAEAKQFNDAAANLAKIKKDLDARQAELTKAQGQLKKTTDDLAWTEHALQVERMRWRSLLEILARTRPENLSVKRIEPVAGVLRITGYSLGSHPANDLAQELGEPLGELGWQVQPARQTSGQPHVGGEPWTFDLELLDSELVSPAALGQPKLDPNRVAVKPIRGEESKP